MSRQKKEDVLTEVRITDHTNLLQNIPNASLYVKNYDKCDLLKLCFDKVFEDKKMNKPYLYCDRTALEKVCEITIQDYICQKNIKNATIRLKNGYNLYKMEIVKIPPHNESIQCIGSSGQTFKNIEDLFKKDFGLKNCKFMNKDIDLENRKLDNCQLTSGCIINEIRIESVTKQKNEKIKKNSLG